MKKGALAKHLLNTTINTALRDDVPKRTIRNLVELGENFSVGRFQHDFFGKMRSMLKNENSIYYKLWETFLTETDPDALKTFGINIGYNVCTSGGETIRTLVKKHGCAIPSVITIQYNGREMGSAEVDNIVRQGEALGIFAYIINYCGGELEPLAAVFAQHKDCGFVFLADDCGLSFEAASKLTEKKNVMLSVSIDEAGFEETCCRLRSSRMLYCVHTRYGEKQSDEILSGALIEKIRPFSSTLALLIPKDGVCANTSAKVGDFAVVCRNQQRYPLIPMDLRFDILAINRIIANRRCYVVFDTDGQLITENGRTRDLSLNITKYSLIDIFRKALAFESPLVY